MIKKHLAIFGNIKMHRVYCQSCKGMTLVKDGIKLCCDSLTDENNIKNIKIECEPTHHRHKPPVFKQKEILEKQQNRCLYCNREFGTPYLRNHRILKTKLNWDHLIPFSYSRNNKNNFVAACHICNGIKSNKMFDTTEEVFHYVEHNRKKKGITYFEDLPPVPQAV